MIALYDEACKFFILCRPFKVICDDKHLRFVNKNDQHSTAHNYETRSNAGYCLTTAMYSKSKCPNSFINHGIQLWNKILNHLNQLSNVREFKKLMKSYLLSLPNDPDI